MQPLVDRLARFLEREILAASMQIERTHGRVAVGRAEQKSLGRTPARLKADGFRFIPPGAKAIQDGVEVANGYQIQRVTLLRPAVIRRASRHLFQSVAQLVLITFDDVRSRDELIESFSAMIHLEPRNRDRESEVLHPRGT